MNSDKPLAHPDYLLPADHPRQSPGLPSFRLQILTYLLKTIKTLLAQSRYIILFTTSTANCKHLPRKCDQVYCLGQDDITVRLLTVKTDSVSPLLLAANSLSFLRKSHSNLL